MESTTPCWCCNTTYPETSLVHLGSHPEVAVCGDCAHFLHRQSAARRDHQHPSLGGYVRRGIDAARSQVIARQWPQKRWLGTILRRLDRHLP